jgi:hypothetical protein
MVVIPVRCAASLSIRNTGIATFRPSLQRAFPGDGIHYDRSKLGRVASPIGVGEPVFIDRWQHLGEVDVFGFTNLGTEQFHD